ncbi:MAG: hypothetical protein PHG23_01940 [Candidatus Pacebacteria bacterium]|nr:hypothetical protein [Candidatus Paceibacterota bacterium]
MAKRTEFDIKKTEHLSRPPRLEGKVQNVHIRHGKRKQGASKKGK